MQRPLLRIALAAALGLAGTALAGDATTGGAAPPAPPATSPADAYAAALAHAKAIEQQLVTTVDTVTQSSVSVLNKQIPKGPDGKPLVVDPVVMSIGSGVLITRNAKTWILTNQHVIDNAVKLAVVTRDGVERPVEVEDTVPQFDIALLHLADKNVQTLKTVPVRGKASAELEEGQWCVATGNPFGLAMDGVPVVTLGVISGLDRVLGGNFLYGRAIQHDAAVNPGNSGGPLWSLRGEFVGINGMIASHDIVAGQTASNTGASYSIPVEQIDAFLGCLCDAKKDAKAGFLGVAAETETDKAGKPVGARVTSIDPRSPVGNAKGLKVGDIIEGLSVAGKPHPIRTATDLTNELSLCIAGCRVTVSFRRLGKPGSWSGELGSQ